jgi:hypothetical protein
MGAPDGLHDIGRIPGGKDVGGHVVACPQQVTDDRPGCNYVVFLEHGEEPGDDPALQPETPLHVF